MAEYSLAATLRARDAGFTSTIRRAQKEAEKLESTAGKIKSEQDLKMKVGVEGMARIERLKGAIEAARQNSNKPLSVRLRDQATQQLSKIRTEINSLTSKAHNIAVNIKTNGAEKLGKLKSSIGEGIGGAAMGMGATMLGTAGIGYGVVNAVQSQMNFEKEMSSVKAILSGSYSGGELDKVMTNLTAKAEEMGMTTKFTSAESAKALYYMGMAGWQSEQMIAGLPAVLNLAAAGNTDLATTSDIVTDSMTAFGLKAGKTVKTANGQVVEMSQHYSDLMAALVTSANTDVLQAGETLKYAAANVGAMYANGTDEDRMRGAEDMFLITGLMANAGIKGSQAGTAARALFARLGSQNRNASFALQALGVDFTDEKYGGTGEVRRIRDIIGDLRARFKEGVSPEQLLDFAETLEGTKLHADTRRKLEGFIQSAQKNGGKLSGGEMLKMAAMLNGQEGMSGLLSALLASEEDWNKLANAIDNADGAAERMSKIQLDNLAGDVTLLGSAWDAFQRNLVKGDASAGLRSFTQSLTDSLTKANELFKDGIDFSDFVALGADVVSKLKNKFLELDGIGSVLAGGALFYGLKKILSLGLKIKDTMGDLMKIRTMSDLGNTLRGNKPTAGGLPATGAMNVTTSTMNVRAGVVNVSGNVKGGAAPMGGAAGGKGAIIAANQARVNDYYARRQQILTSGTVSGRPIPPATATGGILGNLKGGLRAGGGMLGIAAIFGALDVFAERKNSEYLNNEAITKLNEQRQQLKFLQEQGADISQINSQMSKIREAEENVRNVAEMNHLNERRTNAGVAGMLAGTAAGAAAGSVIPIIGTAIGALIGGILGQYGGTWFADNFGEVKKNKTTGGAVSIEERVSQSSVALNRRRQQDIEERELHARERALSDKVLFSEDAPLISARANIRRRKADRIEWENSHFATPDEVVIGAGKAMTRRRDADTKELQKLQRDAYNAEIQANIKKHQQQENLKNFGYTSLGQDYSTTAGQEKRQIDYKKQYNLGDVESERQRGISTNANGQEFINLNQGAFEKFKAKYSGEGKTVQEKNYTQPQATALPFTTTQTPFKMLEKSATEFSGAVKSVKTPLAELKGYTPAETPKPLGMPDIKPPKYDYSKAFQNLPTYSPAENLKPMGMPDIKPPKYDYSAATQNLPTYSPAQNLTPLTMPNLEMPELNIADKLSTEIENVASMADTAWEGLKSSASTAFDEVANYISTGFEAAKSTLSTFGEEISTLFGGGFETVKATLSTFGEEMAMSLSTGFETAKATLLTFGEEISSAFSGGFETLQASISTFGAEISNSFGAAFESLSVMAASTFASLSATISGGVESARATITSAFSSAAAEVQGIWGAIPGFFSGIFGGLGGIAAAAGSSIAAGINSGIGMIMSAWEALSGWLSAKISSLSSMAAGAAAAIGIGGNATGTASWRGGLTEVNEHGGELIVLPSGKEIFPYQTTQNILQEQKIAHNAKGTSFFEGGWSEVNEHGGEIMYLPKGTQIIPHATTVRILREQIKEKLQNGDSYSFNQQSAMSQNSATSNVGYNQSQSTFGVSNTGADFTANAEDARRFTFHSGDQIQTETRQLIGGLNSGTNIFQQQQRQNSATSTLETNAETNRVRYFTQAFNSTFATNNQIEKPLAGNDTAQDLKIAHNYSGTSYFDGGLTTVNEHGGEIITLPNGKNILPQFTAQNIFKDSLGNIQGLKIPEYNRITPDDSLEVKRAKQDAQYQQLLRSNANERIGNSTVHRIFSNVGGRFSQGGYTDRTQKRNEVPSGSLTGYAGLPLGEGQPLSVDIHSGTLERYNSGGAVDSFGKFGNARPTKRPHNPLNALTHIFKIKTPKIATHTIFNPASGTTRGNIFQGTSTPNISKSIPEIATHTIFNPVNGNTRGNIFQGSSISNNIISAQQHSSGNIFDGLINIWRQSQRIKRPINASEIWELQKNFSETDNQLEDFNMFSESQLGELPTFNLATPQTKTATNNNTTNSTTNNKNSNVNLNFGDVNISNGMDFDSFAHRLMTLFNQGASNSVWQ